MTNAEEQQKIDSAVQLAVLARDVRALTEVVKDILGTLGLVQKSQEQAVLDKMLLDTANERLTIRTDALENMHHNHTAEDDLVHTKVEAHLSSHGLHDERLAGRNDALSLVDKVIIRYLVPIAMAGGAWAVFAR